MTRQDVNFSSGLTKLHQKVKGHFKEVVMLKTAVLFAQDASKVDIGHEIVQTKNSMKLLFLYIMYFLTP